MLPDQSKNLKRDILSREFDYIIFGNTFWGAALLYAIAKSGKRVAFITQNDLCRDDNYTYTNIFPHRMSGIFEARRALHNMNMLKNKIPHLVLQQRSLFLSNKIGANLLSSFFNLFSARNKTGRSTVLDLDRYAGYEIFLNSGYRYGILSREFRINESRLLIEILKESERSGAYIVNGAGVDERGHSDFYIEDKRRGDKYNVYGEKVIYVRAEDNLRKYLFNVKAPSETNPVRLISRNYDFMLSGHISGGSVLQARPLKGNKLGNKISMINELNEIVPFCQGSCQRIGIPGNEDFIPSSAEVILDRGVCEEPRVDKSLAELISLVPGFSSLPGEFLSRDYGVTHISDIIESANRLYDEAKQSGIEQGRFMELFYRYGAGIETITEMAYAQRGEGADQEQAWRYAVENYEKLYEWKI